MTGKPDLLGVTRTLRAERGPDAAATTIEAEGPVAAAAGAPHAGPVGGSAASMPRQAAPESVRDGAGGRGASCSPTASSNGGPARPTAAPVGEPEAAGVASEARSKALTRPHDTPTRGNRTDAPHGGRCRVVSDVCVTEHHVTGPARAEGAPPQAKDMPEARIAERTRELADALADLRREVAAREAAEEALRQAQKMEAVGQLAGGIAHDFNNHLTGILGALSLMERRIEQGRTEELRHCITITTTAARRAAALAQRLLALARREPPLDPKRVDVNALVASMEDLLRGTLGPAVALEVAQAAEAWPTLCDPGQIENAVLNLAINARDAMPDGGRLVIRTGNVRLDQPFARSLGGEVRPGDYVTLGITDTGVGMPPEVVARILEPFFTTKPPGRGTGLGIPMVHGFARPSGGHLAIRSEPGHGTTVRLYLPRHGTEAPGAAAMDQAA